MLMYGAYIWGMIEQNMKKSWTIWKGMPYEKVRNNQIDNTEELDDEAQNKLEKKTWFRVDLMVLKRFGHVDRLVEERSTSKFTNQMWIVEGLEAA